jgi:hypothetical protein
LEVQMDPTYVLRPTRHHKTRDGTQKKKKTKKHNKWQDAAIKAPSKTEVKTDAPNIEEMVRLKKQRGREARAKEEEEEVRRLELETEKEAAHQRDIEEIRQLHRQEQAEAKRTQLQATLALHSETEPEPEVPATLGIQLIAGTLDRSEKDRMNDFSDFSDFSDTVAAATEGHDEGPADESKLGVEDGADKVLHTLQELGYDYELAVVVAAVAADQGWCHDANKWIDEIDKLALATEEEMVRAEREREDAEYARFRDRCGRVRSSPTSLHVPSDLNCLADEDEDFITASEDEEAGDLGAGEGAETRTTGTGAGTEQLDYEASTEEEEQVVWDATAPDALQAGDEAQAKAAGGDEAAVLLEHEQMKQALELSRQYSTEEEQQAVREAGAIAPDALQTGDDAQAEAAGGDEAAVALEHEQMKQALELSRQYSTEQEQQAVREADIVAQRAGDDPQVEAVDDEEVVVPRGGFVPHMQSKAFSMAFNALPDEQSRQQLEQDARSFVREAKKKTSSTERSEPRGPAIKRRERRRQDEQRPTYAKAAAKAVAAGSQPAWEAEPPPPPQPDCENAGEDHELQWALADSVEQHVLESRRPTLPPPPTTAPPAPSPVEDFSNLPAELGWGEHSGAAAGQTARRVLDGHRTAQRLAEFAELMVRTRLAAERLTAAAANQNLICCNQINLQFRRPTDGARAVHGQRGAGATGAVHGQRGAGHVRAVRRPGGEHPPPRGPGTGVVPGTHAAPVGSRRHWIATGRHPHDATATAARVTAGAGAGGADGEDGGR